MPKVADEKREATFSTFVPNPEANLAPLSSNFGC